MGKVVPPWRIHSRKTKNWKLKKSDSLIRKLCEKYPLNHPFWKRQMGNILNGCEYIKRQKGTFKERGMSLFRNN